MWRPQFTDPASMGQAVMQGRNCYHAKLWKGMDMQGKWGAGPTVDSCRAQWVQDDNVLHNHSYYYRFSLLFPETWEPQGMCLVHDYHGIARAGQCMSVYANGGNLEWWIVNESPTQPAKNYTRAQYKRPLEPGTWLDLECSVHLDTDWSARTKVTVNGSLWFEDSGINAFPTDAQNGARFVIGPYVWDWSTVTNKRREVFFTKPYNTMVI